MIQKERLKLKHFHLKMKAELADETVACSQVCHNMKAGANAEQTLAAEVLCFAEYDSKIIIKLKIQ